MDLSTYERAGHLLYGELAKTIAAILESAVRQTPGLHLQQVQHRSKSVDSVRGKLRAARIPFKTTLELAMKDLAGCRLIFYTNADVSRFASSDLLSQNF